MKCREEPRDKLEARIRGAVPQMANAEITHGLYAAVSGLVEGVPTIAYVRGGAVPEALADIAIDEEPAVDPEKEALRDQVADLQRQLAERDAEPPPLSPDPVKHMIPDEIRKLMLDDETLPQARQRLWPVLNAELSELKNQEALFNKTIPRRAEVEQLISILARLGEG